MIRFWICQKNPAKSVFGFGNPHLDFPKKTHPKCSYFHLSVHVVVELSSNIMRGNWGFRWWPKNALPQSRRDGPGRCVTLFQFQKDTFGLWLEHGSKKKSRKGSNCPQMRLFTLYKNIHLRSFTCGRTLSGSLSEGVLSDARQPEVRRIFFNMLWRCHERKRPWHFKLADDLSQILSTSTAQECKRCTSA